METRLYRIVDWENLYENNRTRNMKNMLWVPVPVKHDGYGYCQLVQELGAAGLGAWLAILQTAAKSHPRGTLMRDACNPHDAKSISIISRLDAKIIHKTIELCATPDIGWLEVVEIQGDIIQPAEIPHPPAEIPHPPARKGREGKGRERKGNKADLQSDRVLENSPVMIRIGSWFGRRSSTLWLKKESERLDAVNPSIEDIDNLEKYYTANISSKDDYRRKNIETLLNNWQSEIDRAFVFNNRTNKQEYPPLSSNDKMNMTKEMQDEYYRTGVKRTV